jgi:glycosyltransferase involved in cell wall biosynthesis
VTGFVVNDLGELSSTLARLASGELVVDRARCRERAAARFSRERMVDDYLALYEEALGRVPAGARALLQ